LFALEQALGKIGLKPAFSIKFKGAGQAELVFQKLKFWNSLILQVEAL
jgi:hypothetical protein